MMSRTNAEHVEVHVRSGEVTLMGTVKSRDEKRAIEALAESVLGVKDLINSVRVERREEPRGQQAQAQGERRADEQAAGDTPLHS
jgi:hypothetical protein